MTTETLPPALGPEHLTEVLRRAGVLGDGRVSRVAAESWRGKLVSRFLTARLSYEGHADGAPPRVFFKTALTGGAIDAGEVGRREVEFYRQVAPATAPGILPRCFEGVWDAERKDCRAQPAAGDLVESSRARAAGRGRSRLPRATRVTASGGRGRGR